MLPVPTPVIRPGVTAEPLKWVSQPRERKGSRCSRTAGKFEGPSVFMSILRMRGILGLVSKTPLSLVGPLLDDMLFVGVIWLRVFWVERSETRGLM